MTENTATPVFFERLRWIGYEILPGSMIALSSVFTGIASYQGSMSDSDQNKYQKGAFHLSYKAVRQPKVNGYI